MISKGNRQHLHCTMCEIKRAALVSLHVSLPWARSCFTCRANRYLQTERDGVYKHRDEPLEGGEGQHLSHAHPWQRVHTVSNQKKKGQKNKEKKVRKAEINFWGLWLPREYTQLPEGLGDTCCNLFTQWVIRFILCGGKQRLNIGTQLLTTLYIFAR